MEAVLRSINREEHHSYMLSLHSPRQIRIQARHRVLMLKDMPYRDDTGRLFPFSFPLFPVTKLIENRGNNRKKGNLKRKLPSLTRKSDGEKAGLERVVSECEELVTRHSRFNTTMTT